MAVPAQVRKQIEQANALVAQIHGGTQPVEGAPQSSTSQPQQIAAPPMATPTNPTQQQQPPPQQPPPQAQVQPPAQPQAQTQPPAQPQVQPPPPAPAQPPEDWEHKYRVLQGKYDSEVPRLSDQVRALTTQLGGLQRQMETRQQPTPTPPAATKLITQAEIDEFGPELVDLIGRRAREIYDPLVNDLRTQVTDLSSKLQATGEADFKTARARLIDALAGRVPNYDEVNKSPAFLGWLDQADAYSGEQRGQMLKRAYESNDTERVIRFFTGFLSEHAAISPPPEGSPQQWGTPRVNLQDFIAPGTSTTVPNVNGAQGEKRLWRQAEIAAFYAAANRGEFKRNPDERTRIEQDIIAAGREGRVRP